MGKLIYLAPLKWSSYSQRPHYMMRYIAEKFGTKILWVDPFPARLPRVSDVFRKHNVYDQGTIKHPEIEVCSHRAVPIEPLLNCGVLYKAFFLKKLLGKIANYIDGDSVSLGIGKPSCLAKTLLETVPFHRSFYDAMDDYPEFHTGISKRYLASIEHQIAHLVDDVFVSSHYLKDKFSNVNDSVILIPNGYDNDFAQHKELEADADLTKSDKNTIGYVGTLYHWFDWELVIAIAKTVPDANIELIGPVLGEVPRSLPSNIIMLPPCSNKEAARYMKSFTVGLIPFLRNSVTRAVDPIKYYEYRTLGLPVISTLFGDMQYKLDDPGLFLVSDSAPTELASVVTSALAYKFVPGDFRLRENATWPSRFKQADVFGKFFGAL